ncbi:hypothetical protein [Streptomyces sp. NPDC052496]|uniref:hypothetical protein n=1 Tax=Streptomyces sp. NPDC052496 TaxID=3154951 RepID=UPI00344662A9
MVLFAARDLDRDRLFGHVKPKENRTKFPECCRYLRSWCTEQLSPQSPSTSPPFSTWWLAFSDRAPQHRSSRWTDTAARDVFPCRVRSPESLSRRTDVMSAESSGLVLVRGTGHEPARAQRAHSDTGRRNGREDTEMTTHSFPLV